MYFVSVIKMTNNQVEDFRTIGMFENQETCERILKEEVGDPFELHWYKYGLVSKVEAGLYETADDIKWFLKDKSKVREIEKPRELKSWNPYIIG